MVSRGRKITDLALQNLAQENNNIENNNEILAEALKHDFLLETDFDEVIEELPNCGGLAGIIEEQLHCGNFEETGNVIVEDYQHNTPFDGNENVVISITSPKSCDKKLVDYSYSDSENSIMDSETDQNNLQSTYSDNNSASVDIHYQANDTENSVSSSTCNESFNSDFSPANSNSDSSSESLKKGQKRKKKKTNLELQKKRRNSGKSYFNYKEEFVDKKNVLPNPCLNKKCVNQCNNFSENERKTIFINFWKLGGNVEKKNFINGCVNVIPVKRKRTFGDSRRSLTYQYFLMKDGVQKRVCLQFFKCTLNVTQKLIRYALKGKIEVNQEKRGKHEPKHKVSSEQMTAFKDFIQNLPAVPSHYCRGSSTKLYLPAETKSVANLYRMYVSKMTEIDSVPLKISSFKKFFKRDYNIGIHIPRKDKCSTCVRFENIPEAERTENDKNIFLNHQKDKDSAKQLFLTEQNKSAKDGFIVISFDLQKVLGTPHGPSMMFGFSRKYAVYNFTVYESTSKNTFCFVWGEKDGKRGVNEICSNLYSYLTKLDNDGEYKSLSLFCDNCPGQNKNKFVLSMLHYFLKNSKSVEEITLTYLVAGHTYMPVDSVHGVIEKYISNMNIQAPSEWTTIIRNARRRPKPYEVIPVHYGDIFDWKSLSVPKKLKTINGGEIKITDITRVKLNKNNTNTFIVYTGYDMEAANEIQWIERRNDRVSRAYNSELPINKEKMKNLMQLCESFKIKKQYHNEYFALTANNNVPDILPETDIEDD